MGWIETGRGTVYRWEVDNVDHFTVAFYFARFDDATLALLQAIGLDPRASGPVVTRSCHVRYLRELRVGDIFHVESGVFGAREHTLELVHKVIDSGDGTLCTTVEQRVELAEARDGAPSRLLEAADRARVEWTPAPQAAPAAEAHGFRDTARDAIKPWEVDTQGLAASPAYIHRYSAANGHLLAAFGMSPAYLTSERRGFSTFEFRLGFSGALRAGDLVRVRSALVHVGNSSMRILHRMTDVRTGSEVSTLEQAGVHLDMEARRPTPLPPPLRERALAMLAPETPRPA